MEKREFLYRRGQITVFVIIALVLVAAVGGFFLFRTFVSPTIPASMTPIYDSYISCLQENLKKGSSIMGTQAGWIENPDFERGNKYAPFSSQLAFMGFGVPYWYYISGNGIKKEQIPTLAQMNEQLGKFVQDNEDCDFTSFENEGYNISIGEISSSKASITTDKITLSVNQPITISKGEESVRVSNHKIEVNSNLGKFYDTAKKIYNYWKNNAFLENYTMDVLYTYAPVSGTELSCSPVVWNPYDVITKLKSALEANIISLKVSGDYYSLNDKSNYFIVGKDGGLKVNSEQVNFLYSREWPSRFEIWPTKNSLMVAEPIGNQPGLSTLGFCYAPYKFVYDMSFPVLIQVMSSDGSEIFQFPVAVIIEKNVPRQATPTETLDDSADFCDNSNVNITVNTYNINLEPIEAELEFKCFTSVCGMSSTKLDNSSGLASASSLVPQCVNGVITAKAKGYSEKKYFISTNEESNADIILDREKELNVELYVDGSLVNDNSLITLSSNNENLSTFATAINYPNLKKIKLTEGDYRFEVKVFRSGSFVLPETNTRQCVRVPKEGLVGLFGFEEEKCSDITIPSQTLTNLVSAGGYADYYVTQSELESGNIIRFYTTSVPSPSGIGEVNIVEDRVEKTIINMEIV